MRRTPLVGGILGLLLVGCSDLPLDPSPPIIHARFDPDAGIIPMPTDVLRNKATGLLDLPNDSDADRAKLNPTELEFYDYLETLDGWSSLMSATVEFTGEIDPASITPDNLQVWHWTGTPERVADVRISVASDGKLVQIDPPRTGWRRGDRYAVVLRGGATGATGKHGERVECDAAFYFLRQTQRLDTPEHAHAIPGATPEERAKNTTRLEGIREDLAPLFDFFAHTTATTAFPREDVAALWEFTVTTRTELAMDKPSQRMPLPIDLMISPVTHHVDIPLAPWDSPVETEAKPRLADFDGFGLSSAQMFELTAPVDPKTIDATHVKLYRTDGALPVEEPVTVTLHPDRMHVLLAPTSGRLAEATSYAIFVDDAVRDADGKPIVRMPAGHFLLSHTPVTDGAGASTIHAVDADSATRLEAARTSLAPALANVGRAHTLAAWPFKTMSVSAPLAKLRATAASLQVDPTPTITRHLTPTEALGDFAFGISSVVNVGDVYYGSIKSPVFLDKQTRGWRGDGGYEVQDIDFAMTIPKHPAADPMPVVIFGHGLVTERRFVLALGDALAAKGFAAIAIDFPYHGNRTYCATGGPISVVNPTTGQLSSLDPCQAGYTCNDEGRCVDASGQGNHLATFGVISTPVASGAVFCELDHIANSKDHFQQALVDLGALDRVLRTGDWQTAIGKRLDPTKVYYSGQSLGGIMGGLYLGTSPDIPRAVLNVPGAALVDLFDKSTFFSAQMNAFFTRLGVDRASPDGLRLFNVAKWFLDAVDPQHLGPAIAHRSLLIQMATLDGIIPNANTKILQDVTGAPRRDYVAEHGFLVIPVEPEYWRGTADLAKWLNGEQP